MKVPEGFLWQILAGVITGIILLLITTSSPWAKKIISDLGWKTIPVAVFSWAAGWTLVSLIRMAVGGVKRCIANLPRNKFKELYEPMGWCLNKMEELPPGTRCLTDLMHASAGLPRGEVRDRAREALAKILNKLAFLAEDLKRLGLYSPPSNGVEIHPLWLGYLRQIAPLAKHGDLGAAKKSLAQLAKSQA